LPKNRRKKSNVVTGVFTKAENSANKVLQSSRQLIEFRYGNDIIQPPYEPKDLIALIERNDILKQNIEAMASNVANFGYGIKYQDDFEYSAADGDIKVQADTEWATLKRLYNGES